MKDKYTKEVFDFFTTDEDRFKMMVKIARHEPTVIKLLVEEFWNQLKEKLEQALKGKNEDWVVKFSDNFNYEWNKILIYKTSWGFTSHSFPLISVAFEALGFQEHPYVGVYIDSDYNERKEYETEEIKALLRKTLSFQGLTIDHKDQWWPVWKFSSLNLINHDDLLKILPKSREGVLMSLTREAIDLVGILDEFMIKHENLNKFKY